MSSFTVEFERQIVAWEKQIDELRKMPTAKGMDPATQIHELEKKLDLARKEIYAHLTPWQRVQMARHPKRPYTLDYISKIMTDFVELHGDRLFSDDKALIGGFAKLDGQPLMIVGHQKGKDTKENLY